MKVSSILVLGDINAKDETNQVVLLNNALNPNPLLLIQMDPRTLSTFS